MEELLKKINGNMIEIKAKLDKDTFHISDGSHNIGQQNINFNYNTFKIPLESKEKISAKFVSLTLKEKYLTYFFMIFLILSAIFLIYTKSIFWSLISIFSFLIYFLFLIYFSDKKWSVNLVIKDDKLILEEISGEKKDEIDFKDIRSFLKQKSLFGYQFFIYEKTKIEPKFGFAFFSIHKAVAIEELLKSKIETLINEK